MPPPSHRKKPFSAKQKKKQLKDKRGRKREDGDEEWGRLRHRRSKAKPVSDSASAEVSSDADSEEEKCPGIKMINHQPSRNAAKGYDSNRYRLHFQHESQEEISRRTKLAQEPQLMLTESALELDVDGVYHPGSVLDMPKRPPWDYKMSRHKLLTKEESYFRNYLDSILEKYGEADLSYMELNLETWRQLWRVLEMSDVVLLITDIRHPALHFSPALYNFVTKEMKKPLILVLNKIDLAPPSLVVAWQHYFQEKFPDIHIVLFTSFPKDTTEMHSDPEKVLHKKRRKGVFSAVGPLNLLKACESIVQGQVDLSSWREKIATDAVSECGALESVPDVHLEEGDGSYVEHVHFRDGVLTIGCCGYPNVGKSSLMNGLVGKKVVSVSKTPGHTKHFQTIFLTGSVKLCDSPGLVFPSLVSKPLQILAGIYPIAQVREPYTAVGFLAQRIPVQTLLHLKHPDFDAHEPSSKELPWSAYDICCAWAEKRGFLTARVARPDVYRAANSILRLAVEGRLIMCMRPPGFTAEKASWESHPESAEITHLQQTHCTTKQFSSSEDRDNSFSESEDEDRPDDASGEEEEELTGPNPFALLGEEEF